MTYEFSFISMLVKSVTKEEKVYTILILFISKRYDQIITSDLMAVATVVKVQTYLQLDFVKLKNGPT